MPELKAAAPAIPPMTPELERERAEMAARHGAGERLERRRQMRGLVLLAVVVLVLSIARAGWGNVFPHGWWRFW